MWNKEQLLEAAKAQVKPTRFTHIVGVVDTAIQLAKANGIDAEKAEVAAILHDYCKAWSPERLQAVLLDNQDTYWLQYPAPTWHAPAAFYVVQEQFSIADHDILEAIYYHTTGRARMSPLDIVLWVADYIEPNRDFPGVEVARDLAKNDVIAALRYGLTHTIRHLVEREQSIHPLTLEAYNYYVNRR